MQKLLYLFSSVAITVLPFFVGCSFSEAGSVKKLDRRSAKQLIEQKVGKENVEEIQIVLMEGTSYLSFMQDDPAKPAMVRAGLAQIEEIPEFGASDRICFTLTDAGKARAEQWERKDGDDSEEDCPYDITWTIPLGLLKRLEVTGIRNLSDTLAEAEFEVEYDPNELGEMLEKEGESNPFPLISPGINVWEETFKRIAVVELYDDGWRITNIK